MPSMKLLALSTILSGALASTINLNGVRPPRSPPDPPPKPLLTSNRTNAPTAGGQTASATTPRSTAASAHPSSTTTMASAASTAPAAVPAEALAVAVLSAETPATNASPSVPPQRTTSEIFLSPHVLQRSHLLLATTHNGFLLLPSRF